MEEIHRRKSKQKRKHSLGDNDDNSTACHESGSVSPKTKKKKMSKTLDTDPSPPDVVSGDISHIQKQKKILHDEDKTVENKMIEVQGEDTTKSTRKRKSKKKGKDTEDRSLKDGIVETTAPSHELHSNDSNNRELKTVPDERFETQKEDNAKVKGKKSKKKSKGEHTPGTLDHGLNETAPEIHQMTSPEGVEKCNEESKSGSNKMVKDQDGDDMETAGKTKSKKKKVRDSVKTSLGTVDSELVESTAKSLQVNGLDVSITDSPKEADAKKNVSTKKKQKKKKKKKKTDKRAGKKEDEISDQNSVSRTDRALSYLHSWNLDKASWKFNKMNQVQLFHMMYDMSLVSDDDFQILLLYLAGTKGQAKEITYKEAMKLVDGDAENGEEVSKAKEQRAREIVQVLS